MQTTLEVRVGEAAKTATFWLTDEKGDQIALPAGVLPTWTIDNPADISLDTTVGDMTHVLPVAAGTVILTGVAVVAAEHASASVPVGTYTATAAITVDAVLPPPAPIATDAVILFS